MYAWPGGYPLYFVTSDGAALSFEAVLANWRNIVQAHFNNDKRAGIKRRINELLNSGLVEEKQYTSYGA